VGFGVAPTGPTAGGAVGRTVGRRLGRGVTLMLGLGVAFTVGRATRGGGLVRSGAGVPGMMSATPSPERPERRIG
jgi:hypothetical protein